MAHPSNDGIRLIDSSVWIRADRNRKSLLRERLQSMVIAGSARICWPVHAELLVGARDEQHWTVMDEGLSLIEHLPVTDNAWRQASISGRKLARTGKAVPIIDLVVSAVAIEAGLILWTVDSDFGRIVSVSKLQLDNFGAE